jgi:hypothetical protein
MRAKELLLGQPVSGSYAPQFLFQGDGGDNEFADGYYVANLIREHHPEEWKVLTEVPIDFQDIGVEEHSDSEFYKVHSTPTFV